jgi:hypothetical protein
LRNTPMNHRNARPAKGTRCSARVIARPKRVLTVLSSSRPSGTATRIIPRVISSTMKRSAPQRQPPEESPVVGLEEWIESSVTQRGVTGLSRDTRGVACGVVSARRGQPMYFVIGGRKIGTRERGDPNLSLQRR